MKTTEKRALLQANIQAVTGQMPGSEKRVPADVEVLSSQELPEFTRQLISFATEENDRIEAYLLLPRQPKLREGKSPAMLCLHQTTRHRKAEPAGVDGKPNLHYAAELAARGYVALCPDYSLGKNFAEFETSNFDAYENGYASATMKGIWNHRIALDVLQALPQVDGERLGVIGHSLGGHNALFLAAFDERVRVIVSSCGYTSWRACKAQGKNDHLANWSHSGYMPRIKDVYDCDAARMPFDFPEIIASFAPRAFFTNATEADDFDVESVRASIQEARIVYDELGVTEKLEVIYPPGGHDFPIAAREAAYEFIDRWL